MNVKSRVSTLMVRAFVHIKIASIINATQKKSQKRRRKTEATESYVSQIKEWTLLQKDEERSGKVYVSVREQEGSGGQWLIISQERTPLESVATANPESHVSEKSENSNQGSSTS